MKPLPIYRIGKPGDGKPRPPPGAGKDLSGLTFMEEEWDYYNEEERRAFLDPLSIEYEQTTTLKDIFDNESKLILYYWDQEGDTEFPLKPPQDENIQRLALDTFLNQWKYKTDPIHDHYRNKELRRIVTALKEPTLTRANYGKMLVRAIFDWKCFPPFYPKHTLHSDWFEKIDYLRKNKWEKTNEATEDATEDATEAATKEAATKDAKISKLTEVVKLVTAVVHMVWLIISRSKHAGFIMTVVDEIYLTEQLCNLLLGLLYILPDNVKKDDKKRYQWETLKVAMTDVAFSDSEFGALPDNIKHLVLNETDIEHTVSFIETMMRNCVGLNPMLLYLQFDYLKDRNTGTPNEEFVFDSWPDPLSYTTKTAIPPCRKFPLEIVESAEQLAYEKMHFFRLHALHDDLVNVAETLSPGS